MRVLLDTNVLLDVLLVREPHFAASAALMNWAERHPGQSAVAWHSCANLHYLSANGAGGFLRDLLVFAEVPSTGTDEMRHALELPFRDLEDAMQTVAAIAFGAQVIATRNVRDYSASPIRALTPEALMPLLG